MAKIKSFGAALSVAETVVGGINSISIPESDAAEIDLTTHDSSGREFVGGIADYGTVAVSGKFNISDAGQSYLRAPLNQGGSPVPCIVTFSDGSTATFSAVVKGYGTDIGDVDSGVEFSASLRISGTVTYATT